MESRDKIKKNIHDISNAIHNLYETLENIELSFNDDPGFCLQVIRATKAEREKASQSIRSLKKQLKDYGIYNEL